MYQQEMDDRERDRPEVLQRINPNYNLSMLKQQQADNVSMYELEQEILIDKLKHTLAGEIFNPKTGQWDKNPLIDPPMNDKGVHHFILKFGGHLDKNITLSDFTAEQIGEMLIEICNDILEIFWKRAVEFEIKRANMMFIMHIVEHQIFANYRRALDGKERIHRETIIKSVESIVDRQDMNRNNSPGWRGGLSSLFGLNKRRENL